MFALLKQTRTGFYLAMVGLMIMSVLAPVVALAESDFRPGDDVVVSKDTTNLYGDTNRQSEVKAEVTKDTPVKILEEPITEADGTIWYAVRVWDVTGFMAEVDLEGIEPVAPAATDTSAESAPAESAAPVIPWKEPVGFAVAHDNVTCRADASTAAAEILVLTAGRTVEVTGAEVWVEGMSWTPVNCGDQGGFVSTDFIAAEAPPVEVPVEEAPVEAPPVDVPAEDVPAEAPPVEVPAEEAPVEAPPVEVPPVDVPAEPAPAEQALEVSPALPVIRTDVANADVTCRAAAGTGAAEITVLATGATVEITGAEVSADGLGWLPVNCAGVGGFVASQFVGVTAPAEAPVEDAAPVEVPAEDAAPTEGEAPADGTTQTTTEEAAPAAGEAPADDTATETEDGVPAEDETATEGDAPAEDAVSEEPAAPAEDEAATDEETVSEDEGAVDDTATEDAAPAEEAAPAEAEVTDEPQFAITAQAVEETESTSPVEDSQVLGTAIVTGTNGASIACRTAPDVNASVIRVLPEGMGVFVLSEPDANGWMSIVCSDQVGYADSLYLYMGGAASEFTGSVTTGQVANTGNAGLNCRSGASLTASVIGYFPAGSAVSVRGAAQGDWVPVVCSGQEGWVFGEYITATTGAPSNGGGTAAPTGDTVTVVNTEGQGLRCRTAPNGSVITVMAEGTRVSVRGAAEGEWLPIVCAGQSGYAHVGFLSSAGGGSTPAPSPEPAPGGGGGTVTVTGTGSRLNCRSGAGTSYSILTSVADGTVLNVRGAEQGGWLPVTCNGADAWVSTMYVTAGGTSDGGSNPAPAPAPGPDPSTGSATVVNTEGQGLRCRTEPNGATITVMAEGSTVALRSATSGEWQGVVCAGQNGFAHSGYLSIGGSNPAPAPAPAPAPSGMQNGDHAEVTTTLNLRYEPSLGAGIATSAPAGTVVLITSGASNGFYQVNWDGLGGYMHGDYLVKTDKALSKRGGSGDGGGTSGGGGGSATGNAIVDFAMGYLGYPYVWATHGPYSFDCSGFTYWVIYNVTGKNIWYGLWTQVAAGTPVSRDALEPGDLVFFQNTYTAGLSHSGIYIGNNQFIHAQNESTGVVISDLNSSYYGPRWYGAVRIR